MNLFEKLDLSIKHMEVMIEHMKSIDQLNTSMVDCLHIMIGLLIGIGFIQFLILIVICLKGKE